MRVAPLLSALLLAVAVPAAAGPDAPQEDDFSGMHGLDLQALGVVESVRDLSVQPGAQELVVRLDNGRELVVMQNGMRRFHPGDRVRLVADGRGLQVERT